MIEADAGQLHFGIHQPEGVGRPKILHRQAHATHGDDYLEFIPLHHPAFAHDAIDPHPLGIQDAAGQTVHGGHARRGNRRGADLGEGSRPDHRGEFARIADAIHGDQIPALQPRIIIRAAEQKNSRRGVLHHHPGLAFAGDDARETDREPMHGIVCAQGPHLGGIG